MARDQGTDYEKRFPGFKEHQGEGWNWRWEKLGQELVGTFLSMEAFRNGHKVKVREADGVVRLFSAPYNLADQLEGFARGDEVAIIYISQDKPKKEGQSGLKRFKVLRKND